MRGTRVVRRRRLGILSVCAGAVLALVLVWLNAPWSPRPSDAAAPDGVESRPDTAERPPAELDSPGTDRAGAPPAGRERVPLPERGGVAARLAGSVRTPDGDPVSGAKVYVQDLHWGRLGEPPIASTTTAADGSYDLGRVEPYPPLGDVSLVVEKAGYTTARLEYDLLREVRHDEEIIVLRPLRLADVSGRVLDGDGAPLGGASLSVFPEAVLLSLTVPTRETKSLEDGSFAIAGVRADLPLSWRVEREGYAALLVSGRPRGWPQEIVFRLEEAEPLTVLVVNAAETPLAGAWVSIAAAGVRGSAPPEGITDARGILTLRPSLSPPWSVRARWSGVEAQANVPSRPSDPIRIVIPLLQHTCSVQVVWAAAGAPFRRRDVMDLVARDLARPDRAGEPFAPTLEIPLPDFLRVAETAFGEGLPELYRPDLVEATRKSENVFVVASDVAKTVGLYVNGILHDTASIEPGEQQASLEIDESRILRGGSVRLRMLYPDAAPVLQNLFFLNDEQGRLIKGKRGVATEDGSYRIPLLTVGQGYVLTLFKQGFGVIRIAFRLDSAEERDLGTLVLERQASLSGRVVAANGSAIAEAAIHLLDENDQRSWLGAFPFGSLKTEVRTRVDGTFDLAALPPGDYLLVCEVPGEPVVARHAPLGPQASSEVEIVVPEGVDVVLQPGEGTELKALWLQADGRALRLPAAGIDDGGGHWVLDPGASYFVDLETEEGLVQRPLTVPPGGGAVRLSP